MTQNNFLFEFLHSFIMQLPVLLACLAAGAVVLSKWRQAPRASMWALLGFGLAIILCFVVPIGQIAMRYWLMQAGGGANPGPGFAALAVFWSVLRAVTYGLLLAAIFAERSESPASASSVR
jgi:hypothetical protein